jgi:hypothetical protein
VPPFNNEAYADQWFEKRLVPAHAQHTTAGDVSDTAQVTSSAE